MTKKILVTNDEFQKIRKEEESKIWRKISAKNNELTKELKENITKDVINTDKHKREYLEKLNQLKGKFLGELDKELDKYEIQSYVHKIETVAEILNQFFTLHEDKGDYKVFRGYDLTGGNVYDKIAQKLDLFDLIDEDIYKCSNNPEYYITLTYCEGYLTLQAADNEKTFDVLLEELIEQVQFFVSTTFFNLSN